jgi:ABC-2 type transport system permease protein
MTLWAFLKRDWLQETSYRLSFVWRVGSLVFSLAALYFLSQMLADDPPPGIRAYGGDYFAFAVIGFALAEAMWACLTSFSQTVRYDQVVGTLEAMAATPMGLPRLLLYSGVYPLLFHGLRVVAVLLCAALLGARFEPLALLLTLPVFLLTLAIFGSLGLMSASLTLVVKKGDPIAAVFGAVSFLLGGALYPVTSMPEWLQGLAHLLPVTYSIEACRKLLLLEAGWAGIGRELAMLLAFTLLFSLAALVLVPRCCRLARKGGVRVY